MRKKAGIEGPRAITFSEDCHYMMVLQEASMLADERTRQQLADTDVFHIPDMSKVH